MHWYGNYGQYQYQKSTSVYEYFWDWLQKQKHNQADFIFKKQTAENEGNVLCYALLVWFIGIHKYLKTKSSISHPKFHTE